MTLSTSQTALLKIHNDYRKSIIDWIPTSHLKLFLAIQLETFETELNLNRKILNYAQSSFKNLSIHKIEICPNNINTPINLSKEYYDQCSSIIMAELIKNEDLNSEQVMGTLFGYLNVLASILNIKTSNAIANKLIINLQKQKLGGVVRHS